MTKPENPRHPKITVERGMSHGAESMRIFDAAQEAIEETRRLLDEASRYANNLKGQHE